MCGLPPPQNLLFWRLWLRLSNVQISRVRIRGSLFRPLQSANSPSIRVIWKYISTIFLTYSFCVHRAGILMVLGIDTFFNRLTTTTRTVYNCPFLAHSQRHREYSGPFRNIYRLQFKNSIHKQL